MAHSAMVASIASPMVTRTLTAVGQRLRQLHIPYMILIPMILFARDGRKRKDGVSGRCNPLKRLDSRKGKSLDFASPGLDFPSPRLGFSFPKAWIFLPLGLDFPSTGLDFPSPARAEGELSG